MEFHPNPRGWDELNTEIIEKHGVPMMQAVADACNLELVKSAMKRGTVSGKARTDANARVQNILDLGKGYMVGVEGDEALELHNYRATVITASAAAMRHNGKRNTLLRFMPVARRVFGGKQ